MVRPSGLGKGLGALLPAADIQATVTGGAAATAPSVEPPAAAGGNRLTELPIASIRPNQYQPRSVFDDESLEGLAASIRELGVLQPILVRTAGDGEYELIAGERRWRAARRAGLETIPAVVRSADDRSSLEQALVENLHRADLNALEEAAAFQQLIDDFSFTHDQVATRVGKSRAAVTNALRLFQLSPSIQKLVMDGQLGAGHARALLGTTDKAFQEAMAKRCVSDGLSVRAVEEAVRLRTGGAAATKPAAGSPAATSGDGGAKASDRPAAVLELEELITDVLDTRVHIDLAPNRKGRVTIEFADLADLERIYKIITDGPEARG